MQFDSVLKRTIYCTAACVCVVGVFCQRRFEVFQMENAFFTWAVMYCFGARNIANIITLAAKPLCLMAAFGVVEFNTDFSVSFIVWFDIAAPLCSVVRQFMQFEK